MIFHVNNMIVLCVVSSENSHGDGERGTTCSTVLTAKHMTVDTGPWRVCRDNNYRVHEREKYVTPKVIEKKERCRGTASKGTRYGNRMVIYRLEKVEEAASNTIGSENGNRQFYSHGLGREQTEIN